MATSKKAAAPAQPERPVRTTLQVGTGTISYVEGTHDAITRAGYRPVDTQGTPSGARPAKRTAKKAAPAKKTTS